MRTVLATVLVAVVTLTGTATTVLLPGAPAHAAAGGYAMRLGPGACVYDKGALSLMGVAEVRVKMARRWARTYTAQWVRVTTTLEGRAAGGAWTHVDSPLRQNRAKVKRKFVTRFKTIGQTFANVPAGTAYGEFRARVLVEWISPRTGRREKARVGYAGSGAAGSCSAWQAPSGVTGLGIAATGADRQVRADFAVSPAVGDQVVECRPSCGSFEPAAVPASGQTGLSFLVAPATFTNGSVASVDVRTCLVQARSVCSPWASDTTTPYGPLAKPSISASANGEDVEWSISGSGNGKPVTVSVTANGTQIWSGSFSGVFSRTGTLSVGYSQTRNLQVTLTDSGATAEQPSNRGTQAAAASATTPAAAPTVTVTRGGSCQTSACTGAQVACSATCYYILTTGHDFPATTTCRVFYQAGGSSPFTWSQGNAQTNSAGNWVGSNVVFDVRCDNGASTGWRTI
ncbi:hypothetical protein GCM10023066_01600 [Nocardioides kongjuensis]